MGSLEVYHRPVFKLGYLKGVRELCGFADENQIFPKAPSCLIGMTATLAFAATMPYVVIVVGRLVLRRKHL